MMSERATIAPDKTALNDDLDENDFLSVDLDQLSQQYVDQQLNRMRHHPDEEDAEEDEEEGEFETMKLMK